MSSKQTAAVITTTSLIL